MTHAPERRLSPRRLVNFKVHHRDPRTHKVVLDFGKDVSAGGIFIWTKRHRVIGDQLEVEFEAGDARRRHGMVKAICRVTRTTGEGVAVAFVEMDEGSTELLKKFLAS